MKYLAALLAPILVSAVALLPGAGQVSAHASLVSSNPTDKQVLATAPSAITMTFTDNLAPAPGSFIYVESGGTSAAAGAATISASDTKTMTLPLLATAGAGQYSVFWKSTSADDGGVTFGQFTFFVGTPSPSDVAAAPTGASVAVPDDATDEALMPAPTKPGSSSIAP